MDLRRPAPRADATVRRVQTGDEGQPPIPRAAGPLGATLADTSEDALLAQIFPLLRSSPDAPLADDPVLVGPGDDAAVLAIGRRSGSGDLVATTDAMVRGRDWLDEWSSGEDVGAKIAAQNLADVAAMGARPVGLLVTLVAEPSTPTAWALDLSRGIGAAAAEAGCTVVGGDLSSAGEGVLMVSVTALGELDGRRPVLRSGARVGDVVAVCGTLGLADAGWRLLREGRQDAYPQAVARQRRPQPPLAMGPVAAHTATAMIDVSDGLLRDADRIARASGVCLDLQRARLAADVERLTPALGVDVARECVLAGGEEHSLLATFPAADQVPDGFRVIGEVSAVPVDGSPGVLLDGGPSAARGWDHFASP